MKYLGSSDLISREARNAWFDPDRMTREEQEDYVARALKIDCPEPCVCGSGLLADIPWNDDNNPARCIVCLWEAESGQES